MRRRISRIVFVMSCGTALAAVARGDDPSDVSAAEVFQRRILPIARSQAASSCSECHFGGVDLRQYILPDQASTFAALREAQLIDVAHPDESKLLTFISRKPEKEEPLQAQVRRQEFDAFRAWIRAAVRDPAVLAAKADTDADAIGPDLAPEVIRHGRHDRVLRSFVENIWIEVERCIGCHSPESPQNKKLAAEHGEHITWIVPRDPAATLATCIEHAIIDTDQPDESLILQKPLGLVKHGGHIKFVPGSRTDQQFRRFLNDFAAVVNGTYKIADDLPEPTESVLIVTGQHLRLVDVPEAVRGKLVRIDLYRPEGDGWSRAPVATADGPANPKQAVWQSMVFALAPRDRTELRDLLATRQLPGGRYLAKVYVDRDGLAEQDRDYVLGERELFGEAEFGGDWGPGWREPKIVTAPQR